MDMLGGLAVVNISQCLCISCHQVVYLKYITIFDCQLYINKTRKKKEREKRRKLICVAYLCAQTHKMCQLAKLPHLILLAFSQDLSVLPMKKQRLRRVV